MITRRIILLVQRGSSLQTELVFAFERRGWVVREAHSLLDSLSMLKAEPPDWLLIDGELLEDDGQAIRTLIRALRVPIRLALCTTTEEPYPPSKLVDLEPDLLFRKPINPYAVLAGIDESQARPPRQFDEHFG